MADVVDSGTRSRMMSGIKGKHTRPELLVRSGLHHLGFRFRLHPRNLPGRPDLVLPKYGVAIFVHGCFWHRHPGCKYATTPTTREDFWRAKFEANVERDRRKALELREAGWRVLTVWECALRHDPERAVVQLAELILDSRVGSAELPDPEESPWIAAD
jgi:DNA mismatch endonuclease (patch repair protein)